MVAKLIIPPNSRVHLLQFKELVITRSPTSPDILCVLSSCFDLSADCRIGTHEKFASPEVFGIQNYTIDSSWIRNVQLKVLRKFAHKKIWAPPDSLTGPEALTATLNYCLACFQVYTNCTVSRFSFAVVEYIKFWKRPMIQRLLLWLVSRWWFCFRWAFCTECSETLPEKHSTSLMWNWNFKKLSNWRAWCK